MDNATRLRSNRGTTSQPSQSSSGSLARALRNLERICESGGFRVAGEIDQVGRRVALDLTSADRHICIRGSFDRCDVVIDHLSREVEKVGRRGDAFCAEVIKPRLLTRQTGIHLRDAIRVAIDSTGRTLATVTREKRSRRVEVVKKVLDLNVNLGY